MFISTHYLLWEDWSTALPHPSLPPITPPSLTPPLYADYINESQAGHRHTSIFNNDTLCDEDRPPPSIKSNFTHKTLS